MRPLSPREAEIMTLIEDGRTNREIASLTLVEPKTIKNRVRRIYARLGAGSRADAVGRWKETAA